MKAINTYSLWIGASIKFSLFKKLQLATFLHGPSLVLHPTMVGALCAGLLFLHSDGCQISSLQFLRWLFWGMPYAINFWKHLFVQSLEQGWNFLHDTISWLMMSALTYQYLYKYKRGKNIKSFSPPPLYFSCIHVFQDHTMEMDFIHPRTLHLMDFAISI